MQGQEPVMKGISTKVSFTGVCGAYVYEKEDIQFLLELTKPVIPLIECKSFPLLSYYDSCFNKTTHATQETYTIHTVDPIVNCSSL